MSALGEQLKQARESQNLSLAQIAEETKIRTDHIEAIEAGRYDIFAAPVYARGSVRTYVRLLKLDEDAAMEMMKQEMDPEKPKGFLQKLSLEKLTDSPFKSNSSKPEIKKSLFSAPVIKDENLQGLSAPSDSESPELLESIEPEPAPAPPTTPPKPVTPVAPVINPVNQVFATPEPAAPPKNQSPFSKSEERGKKSIAEDPQQTLPLMPANTEAPHQQFDGSARAKKNPAGPAKGSRPAPSQALKKKPPTPQRTPSKDSDFEAMAKRSAMKKWILSGALALVVLALIGTAISWYGKSNQNQGELDEALKELGNGLFLPANHKNSGVQLALPKE
jgi:transcriptional regulator with XRE-family HTH domain